VKKAICWRRTPGREIVGFAMLAVERVIRDQEMGRNFAVVSRQRKPDGMHIA
jgi:hypothetical protein